MNAAQDPANLIAVVGMAGRFPGAADVDALWTSLAGGVDAIGPVPPERWDASAALDPERDIQAVGGFIDGVDHFDAGFFGVSPREAAAIDPQQRLLLEIGWQALEDAGCRAADLAGTDTGVYVGASWHDYELLRQARSARPTPHSLVGNALDVIAARLSYFLKLRGPSMAVETGCSSSLVALHLAGQALRAGEIGAAIVGGVNLMLDPHVTVGLTHFGGLSPDGRCATFSASANGFVRGEGVAALYVKTLARAMADGDRIHGVIMRTVVNNDGGGESLVTPSRQGQEDLLRKAYADELVPAGALAYVEAHGTGTGRGDPIEATAIGRMLGAGRETDPLLIGSVKTNIGHLEACAGMAGLVKVLLSLRHRVVPPSLHSAELNPEIDFDGLNLRVAREPIVLPATGSVYMGLNSFGWGGTNAHVVVMSPPSVESDVVAQHAAPVVIPLSAMRQEVLAERAATLAEALPESDLTAVAATLGTRRDHFPVRAAVIAADREEAVAGLTALAGDTEDDGVLSGRAVPRDRVAFVFPGQGSQWAGMGRELYRDDPVFAAVIDRCAKALRPHVDWDLTAVFAEDAEPDWMSRIDMVQPVLWATSLALANCWQAAGVEPDVVLGHSQGEITAATLAGILSYEDAALVMARRSAIVRRASGHGRMLAVDLSREDALAALEGFEETVSLAVHNGPTSCVLSGDEESVLALRELLEADGVFCRLVNVDYGSHSPEMDGLREDLLTALADARPRQGTIELMSTVRVAPMDGADLDAAYWADNLRSPVLFADAMTALFDEGVTHVVEISPHPVLVPAIEQLVAARSERPAVLPTLRRDKGSARDLAFAYAGGYVTGLEPFGPRVSPVPVPGYPFQRERHWIPARSSDSGAARGFDAPPAPAPGLAGTWHSSLELSLTDLPWLGEHRVHDTPVLPGAAMLVIAANTARAHTGLPVAWSDIGFHEEIALGEEPVRLTAELRETGFRLLALRADGAAWDARMTARVERTGAPAAAPSFPDWTGEPTDPAAFYADCARRGLGYGQAFQGIQALTLREGARESLAELRLAPGLRPGMDTVHPALLDAAMQASLALFPGAETLVPTSVRRIQFHGEPGTAHWSYAKLLDDGTVDLHLFDEARTPRLSLYGLSLSALPGAGHPDLDAERVHWLDWTDGKDRPEVDGPAEWVVYGADPSADKLAEALATQGLLVDRAEDTTGQVTSGGVVFVVPGIDAGLTAQRHALNQLTEVVRACSAAANLPRLAVVTALGQPVLPDDIPDPGAALFWGYGRVLSREHGELRPRLIDVDPAEPDWAECCAAELAYVEADDQTALRAGKRLVARLRAGIPDTPAEVTAPPTRWQPFRVGDDLRLIAQARRAPGQGEVEIEVSASTWTGGCAGRIAAVGEDVDGWREGDRVTAWGTGSAASHVIVRADHVQHTPAQLADSDAASLVTGVAAAWHALADCTWLDQGERVLVQADPGGPGAAAVQLARLRGATVFAEGDPDLTRFGAVPQIGRTGFDVVLDARAGAAVDPGLLADGGRYVRVGPPGQALGGDLTGRGLTVAVADVAALRVRKPERFAALLKSAWEPVSGGRVRPGRTAALPFADLRRDTVLDTVLDGLVLVAPLAAQRIEPVPMPDGRFRPDGTYLISGGTGALGLSLAEYLAERGAGAIVLLARSEPGPEAQERIAAIGAEVVRCDVSKADEVGEALDKVRPDLPPVRGVVHAAGVLADATIGNLTPALLAEVLAPKVDGALALAEATRDDPLDLFVLFSSAAALVGNAGQAAYAAGNAYLDAFAAARVRKGLPALSVQWGPFAEVGLAAESDDRGARLADRGMLGFRADEAWPALAHLITRPEPVIGYVALSVRQWFDSNPDTAALATWQVLRATAASGRTASSGTEFRAIVQSALPEARAELVAGKVRELACRVLRLDPVRMEPDTPFKALGLDSLMSLELRNRLEAAFGLSLSPTLLWAYGNAKALAGAVDDRLGADLP